VSARSMADAEPPHPVACSDTLSGFAGCLGLALVCPSLGLLAA